MPPLHDAVLNEQQLAEISSFLALSHYKCSGCGSERFELSETHVHILELPLFRKAYPGKVGKGDAPVIGLRCPTCETINLKALRQELWQALERLKG